MLVLSRQLGQTVVIGKDIEVKVVEIRGGRVRLGIEAPREVSVNRREIYDRIHEDTVRYKYSSGANPRHSK